MKESNMVRADFITSIVLVAFGLAVLGMSLRMPSFAARGTSPYSAPGLVPGILGAIIALCGLVLFIRSIRQKGYRLGITGGSVREFFTSVETVRLLTAIVVSVAYASILLGRIPYPLATGLYVLVFVLVFEYKLKEPLARQWRTVILAAVLALLTAVLVTAVFQYLFLVELPG